MKAILYRFTAQTREVVLKEVSDYLSDYVICTIAVNLGFKQVHKCFGEYIYQTATNTFLVILFSNVIFIFSYHFVLLVEYMIF